MNISGIRPYAGFYDYNSIKASEIRNQQIQASQQSDSVQQEPVGVAMSAQASAQTAVEQNTAKMDEQKNKEIAEIKKEETKKRHKTNLGSFLAGVAGGLILHAYF